MGGHSGPVKDKAIQRHLGCTLEELFTGSTRKLKITRTIFSSSGQPRTAEEILEVAVKPGWKKGTKVTFPEKGEDTAWVHATVQRLQSENGHQWWRSGRFHALYAMGAAVMDGGRAGLCAATCDSALCSEQCAYSGCPAVRNRHNSISCACMQCTLSGITAGPNKTTCPEPPCVCAAVQVMSAQGTLQQTWCSSLMRSHTRASSKSAAAGAAGAFRAIYGPLAMRKLPR
jgi:hypothetical protein